MDSLVSIIVPVYNVEEYLGTCVESIVNQTYKNIEIILVDDGSNDSCPQKCDAWAEKDNRIQVIHKENAGVGEARNTGLDIAQGAYVTFADSDDYLSLDAIEIMLRQIEQDQTDMVVAKKVKVHVDGRKESAKCYDWKQNLVISKEEALRMFGSSVTPFPASACAKLYRKELFDQVRFLNLKTAEDTCIAPFVIDKCQTISLVDAEIYFYFQRETSNVHTMSKVKQLDGVRAVLIVSRFLFDRNYLQEALHYYHAAICKQIELKHDKMARQIIRTTFNSQERKLLRKRSDRKMILSILAYCFPNAYKWYTARKGR